MKKIYFLSAAILISVAGYSQNVGIGVLTPAEKLDVAGHIKTTGEIKPNGIPGQAGQVLQSNGNGTMQWTDSKSGGSLNGGWGDCSIYNIDSFRVGAGMSGQAGDVFGRTVSMSGDYAIVGAYYDSEGGFTSNGSATIFKFNTTTGQWDNQGKILNPDPANSDYFGSAVSISGDYAIVGAYADDENGFSNTGSATIFKRNLSTGVWESQVKLTNPNAANQDNFGVSVFIYGDYAIVGATGDDEEGFTDNGSATIFKRNTSSGNWEVQNKIINPTPAHNDLFGVSVCMTASHAIVGAGYDDEDGTNECGSASIYWRNPGTGNWESPVKLKDPNGYTNDYMGLSVYISGDYAIIGIPYKDDGINTDNGAAIIFKRNPQSGLWQNQGSISNMQAGTGDKFGLAVSINDSYAMVGAPGDDQDGGIDNGTATIFKRTESVWYPHQKFTNPGMPNNGINFGAGLSLQPNKRFIVGAPYAFNNTGMVFFGTIK